MSLCLCLCACMVIRMTDFSVSCLHRLLDMRPVRAALLSLSLTLLPSALGRTVCLCARVHLCACTSSCLPLCVCQAGPPVEDGSEWLDAYRETETLAVEISTHLTRTPGRPP
jgi:hypothetical protein